MGNDIPQMIDLLLELSGNTPAPSYPFQLWKELARLDPRLGSDEMIGMLPLRIPPHTTGLPLYKRARLALRLPVALAESIAENLTNQALDVNGSRIQLGKAKMRSILPSSTLHAAMIIGHENEIEFMDDLIAQLKKLNVIGNLICGKRHSLEVDSEIINGYSVVIHDLKPEASLKLQYAGLGNSRRYGCGIFIPYKAITGLNDD